MPFDIIHIDNDKLFASQSAGSVMGVVARTLKIKI